MIPNKYKIIISNNDPHEDTKLITQRFLKSQKNKILCLIFIGVYQTHPTSISPLINHLSKNMHFSLDKSTIYNALQKIFNFNLISKKNIYDLENSDIDKLIISKHQKFLETIPENFRNRFDKVQYYYVTEYG